MLLKISEKELLVLEQLTLGDASAGELATALAIKQSSLSRLLKSLLEKGLVLIERKGASRVAELSPASHAQGFKRLFESRPIARIEQWLSGKALGVLVAASQGSGIEVSQLPEEAGCSKPALYKVMNALYSAGVAAKAGKRLVISDPLVSAFADSYADNLQLILQKQVRGISVSVRVRKHVILRTDSKAVPPYFSETGISALAKRGLEAVLTDYRDY